ncbi:NAD(P)-binding protein [Cytidiella melzeri]|nr:NAD(P)-binding protein [Cytidiella melzeri]
MPAVQSGKILVSGANGYIAAWLIQKLLDQGYSVRGTVRSTKSLPHLQQLFKAYGDKLELVIVPDITKAGAFDEAVQGIDAVAHTASPFHHHAEHPKDMIDPAVLGTTGMLESVLQHGHQVKRLIILSSVVAIAETSGYTKPTVLTEEDWNVSSAVNCETLGKDASVVDMYWASKTLAERAAWDFATKHKGEIKFDIVALNPSFVHGPFLHDVASPENLNTSLQGVYDAIIKGGMSDGELAAFRGSWVDVRDVADAHVLSLQKEEAGGQRITIASGPLVWQQWVHAAHQIDNSLPAGIPGFDDDSIMCPITFDTTKSHKILGIEYIGIAQSTKDVLAQFKGKGWY